MYVEPSSHFKGKMRNIHVKHVSATVDTATIQTTLILPVVEILKF